MDRWVRIAAADQFGAGRGRTVQVSGMRLALFNDGGRFFALDDACPHQGASLGEGILHDGRIICPRHSWVFDLRTGRCPRETHEPVRCYPTRQVGDEIEVRLPVAADC